MMLLLPLDLCFSWTGVSSYVKVCVVVPCNDFYTLLLLNVSPRKPFVSFAPVQVTFELRLHHQLDTTRSGPSRTLWWLLRRSPGGSLWSEGTAHFNHVLMYNSFLAAFRRTLMFSHCFGGAYQWGCRALSWPRCHWILRWSPAILRTCS